MIWRVFSRRVRPLQQMEAAECGVACLAMVLDYQGERQRLGLAQAFLGRPSVLFLDEATCFLDAATEQRVIDNFIGAGVTVVSVAHRPAVIEASRRVFLVRDGRVSAVHGADPSARARERAPVPRARVSRASALAGRRAVPKEGAAAP